MKRLFIFLLLMFFVSGVFTFVAAKLVLPKFGRASSAATVAAKLALPKFGRASSAATVAAKLALPNFIRSSYAAMQEEGHLKFGVAPSNANSRESLDIFVKFLSEKTGKNFELVYMETDDLLKGLAEGRIAFADLSSSAFAAAVSNYKDKIRYVVTVAARNEKGELVPYYKGIFFALKESPYKSVLDLKGKSFAFVSRTSTSGYLYPLATLNGMGIDPETFFGSLTFAGDHAKIFEGLKSGFLDAGVSNFDAFDKARVLYGNIFKVIGETEEIPSGAVVASAGVDSGTVARVQDALIAVKQTDPVVNYPGFLYKGFIKKGTSFYDFIKQLVNRLSRGHIT